MDIETKAYQLRSTGIAGQVEIRNKTAGRSSYVRAQDLPSAHSLAMMHENAFNQLCAGLMQ